MFIFLAITRRSKGPMTVQLTILLPAPRPCYMPNLFESDSAVYEKSLKLEHVHNYVNAQRTVNDDGQKTDRYRSFR